MENKQENNQDKSDGTLFKFFKKKVFIFLCIIIFILFILYLIEKFVFIILTLLTFTKLISFPLQIILHLLLIRYIVIQIAFVGQNFITLRSVLHSAGRAQASQIKKDLNSLHDVLALLIDIRALALSVKELNDIKKQVNTIKDLNNYFIDIFNRMRNKFHELTIDQDLFYNNISQLNDSINNGNLISFVNNTINTIKKYNKESLADIPDEEKNEILSKISNRNLNVQKMLVLSHNIMEQIDDYIGDKYFCFNMRYIRNYFKNNLFASLEQLHIELNNYYQFEENYFITKDNCKLEYIIIKNNILNSTKKKLMIICGPNGVPIQIFARNFRFQLYLDNNIDVLFWNYRGYGFSQGNPSYSRLRTDVLELFDKIKQNYNYQKYAVHGISIGGIPCCHLASNRKEIELMICDRNFGKLDNITQSFCCGKYLFILYKFLFFQSSDNVDNYLNANCYKIILNDPKDSIVLETCSLKTLISKVLIEKYFHCSPPSDSDSSINLQVKSYSNELESLSNKNNISNSHDTLSDKISVNENNSKIIKKTALDKIFNSVEEKNKFVQLFINISKIINSDELEGQSKDNCINSLINKIKNKTLQYSNVKEEELQNTSGVFDFVKNHMVDILDSIESAGDTLFTLLIIERDYTKEIFIDNFFNNMFIWGSKHYQMGDKFNLHNTKNIKNIFDECMKLFEEFWNSQEIISYKGLPLLKDIDTLYKYFIQIQNNLKYVGLLTKEGYYKLTNDENNNSYEKCLEKINIGNLVPLNCGHNGFLSIQESEIFEMYLNQSNFFNDNIEEYLKDENDKLYEDKEDVNNGSDDSEKNMNKI